MFICWLVSIFYSSVLSMSSFDQASNLGGTHMYVGETISYPYLKFQWKVLILVIDFLAQDLL